MRHVPAITTQDGSLTMDFGAVQLQQARKQGYEALRASGAETVLVKAGGEEQRVFGKGRCDAATQLAGTAFVSNDCVAFGTPSDTVLTLGPLASAQQAQEAAEFVHASTEPTPRADIKELAADVLLQMTRVQPSLPETWVQLDAKHVMLACNCSGEPDKKLALALDALFARRDGIKALVGDVHVNGAGGAILSIE